MVYRDVSNYREGAANDARPQNAIIHVVLGNHSASIYKETMAYKTTRSGRFDCVHTILVERTASCVQCNTMILTTCRHIEVSLLKANMPPLVPETRIPPDSVERESCLKFSNAKSDRLFRIHGSKRSANG